MVIKPKPIFAAAEDLGRQAPNAQRPTLNVHESEIKNRKSKVILMSPAGRRFDQQLARQLSQEPHLIIVCGHYEGVDHRVIEHLIDLEISIGDYVLTNGAITAVVLVDAVVRLLPGVLGHEQSATDDSFATQLLEAPQYTRTADATTLAPAVECAVLSASAKLLANSFKYHAGVNSTEAERITHDKIQSS